MTAKKYLIIRLAVAAILAGIVSSSILTGNYILPIVAVAAFAAFLYTMKKKVKEVMIDERDFAIAGDAARYALNLYAGQLWRLLFYFHYGRNIRSWSWWERY